MNKRDFLKLLTVLCIAPSSVVKQPNIQFKSLYCSCHKQSLHDCPDFQRLMDEAN